MAPIYFAVFSGGLYLDRPNKMAVPEQASPHGWLEKAVEESCLVQPIWRSKDESHTQWLELGIINIGVALIIIRWVWHEPC